MIFKLCFKETKLYHCTLKMDYKRFMNEAAKFGGVDSCLSMCLTYVGRMYKKEGKTFEMELTPYKLILTRGDLSIELFLSSVSEGKFCLKCDNKMTASSMARLVEWMNDQDTLLYIDQVWDTISKFASLMSGEQFARKYRQEFERLRQMRLDMGDLETKNRIDEITPDLRNGMIDTVLQTAKIHVKYGAEWNPKNSMMTIYPNDSVFIELGIDVVSHLGIVKLVVNAETASFCSSSIIQLLNDIQSTPITLAVFSAYVKQLQRIAKSERLELSRLNGLDEFFSRE